MPQYYQVLWREGEDPEIVLTSLPDGLPLREAKKMITDHYSEQVVALRRKLASVRSIRPRDVTRSDTDA
jgi:hypothetical protein